MIIRISINSRPEWNLHNVYIIISLAPLHARAHLNLCVEMKVMVYTTECNRLLLLHKEHISLGFGETNTARYISSLIQRLCAMP